MLWSCCIARLPSCLNEYLCSQNFLLLFDYLPATWLLNNNSACIIVALCITVVLLDYSCGIGLACTYPQLGMYNIRVAWSVGCICCSCSFSVIRRCCLALCLPSLHTTRYTISLYILCSTGSRKSVGHEQEESRCSPAACECCES